jgi:RNA polymerase primary sigma factor
VKNAVRSRGRQVRLPDELLVTLRTVKAAEHGLLQQQGREPTIAEISRESGVVRCDVERVLALANQPVSLDALRVDQARGSRGEDASTQEFELVLIRQLVAQTLSELNRRERSVMELRFGLGSTPHTLQPIGDVLGLTHEGVRKIQNAPPRPHRPPPPRHGRKHRKHP